jgi:pimeloyl-ACP methyl ester carboxylesterase
MARQYDLIGFSPRGTGASTNLTCPSEESFRFDSIIAVDDSQANFDSVLHNSRLIAENCAQNLQTPYMNSETTARDLDMVRHLLGDDKFNYIGYSYGTWLGTWYAGLFPERVGRMLLIGNADITAPLNDVLLPQGQGMQRVMDEALAAYASRHPDRFRLGGTIEEVKQAYLSLRTMVPRHLLAATAESQMNTISKSNEADKTLFTLRAAQMMQGYLAANPGAGEAKVKAWIEGAQFVPDGKLNKQVRAKALDLNGSYFFKVRHETEKAALTGQDAQVPQIVARHAARAIVRISVRIVLSLPLKDSWGTSHRFLREVWNLTIVCYQALWGLSRRRGGRAPAFPADTPNTLTYQSPRHYSPTIKKQILINNSRYTASSIRY